MLTAKRIDMGENFERDCEVLIDTVLPIVNDDK